MLRGCSTVRVDIPQMELMNDRFMICPAERSELSHAQWDAAS